MGNPQGEVLGWITPFYKKLCNCFFTSFSSINDYLYNPIFFKGEFGNNSISWSSFLLVGIPLSFCNSPLYSYRKSSNWCFFSLVHPSKDVFTFNDSSIDWFSLRKSKIYLLLELINFLVWLALTCEFFYFPFCTLIMKDFLSLMRKYWLVLHMNMTSLIYM